MLFQDLDKGYCGEIVTEEIAPNIKKFSFKNQTDFILFHARIMVEGTFLEGGKPISAGWIDHLYFPIELNFVDISLLKKIAERNQEIWMLVEGDTPLDRWVEKQWRAAGIHNILLGVKKEIDGNIGVHGNSVIKVSYSPETKAEINNLYKDTKDLTSLFKYYTKQLLHRTPISITVEVTRDPPVASMLFNQIKQQFEALANERRLGRSSH